MLFTLVFSERPSGTELIAIVPRPQSLERGARRKNVRICITSPDDLHPDGQIALRKSRRNRGRGVTREVDEVGETPPDQRVDLFSIDLGWAHGISIASVIDGQTSQGWRDQEIVPVEGALNGIVHLRPDLLIPPKVEG